MYIYNLQYKTLIIRLIKQGNRYKQYGKTIGEDNGNRNEFGKTIGEDNGGRQQG